MGLGNFTNVTMKNITDIINISTGDPTEFFINANHIIYGGWFFFIMLWVLGFILYKMAQHKQDQPLINAMYIMTALTIVSFFMRAISMIKDGIPMGLLTDFQMWIFPLFTAILAAVVKFMSD